MTITPGLICKNGELFEKDGEIFAVIGGSCLPYEQFPQILLLTIDASITPDDHAALDKIKITDPDERRKKWLKCNVGAFDHNPDYVFGDQYLQREYVECPLRGECKVEGKLCRTKPQLSGLTPMQLLVLEDMYLGLLYKEIAHKRGISEFTVKSHAQNIRIRTGEARKSDLVRYATNHNLISQND